MKRDNKDPTSLGTKKTCSICKSHMRQVEFVKKEKGRWRSYCKKCRNIHRKMMDKRRNEPIQLLIDDTIEYQDKSGKQGEKTLFVTYKQAIELIEGKVAYAVHPKLIKGYFNKREFRDLLFQRFGNICTYCGGDANTIDHVIPISAGGLSSFSNCVPACWNCNNNKDNLDISNYFYYYKPTSVIMGLSRINLIENEIMNITNKISTIRRVLENTLIKMDRREATLANLKEVNELETIINSIVKQIAKYKERDSTELKSEVTQVLDDKDERKDGV